MDLKTSLLVNEQLPEFVRNEYPLFVSFLEAYYEFLETERYTNINGELVSQKNNLIEKLKDLKNIADIDFSLNEFEEQFFNTFISYLPKDTVVTKDFLIKNILPLYKSKGNEKSFRYLFRLLFGEEIEIEYPGKNVLRASDGKWKIDNIIKTYLEVYSEYIVDGTTKIFDLPYELEKSQIQVYIDDNFTEDYYIRKEQKKIYFNGILNENSIIKINYNLPFNVNIFKNCKIEGLNSGATSIVEDVSRTNIGGLNLYDFFVNEKNILGIFKNGELLKITFVTENNILLPFYLQTFSEIEDITVTNPGSGYRIGDTVILRGSSLESAVAVVDAVSLSTSFSLFVKPEKKGAGYKIGNDIALVGYPNTIFYAVVNDVDDSGTLTPNTFNYNTDIISNYLQTNISAFNYQFPSDVVPIENLNTIISDALTNITITNLGPVTNALVLTNNVEFSTAPIGSLDELIFDTLSTQTVPNLRISDLNSIGIIRVLVPGTGYSVGDQVIFTNTQNFSGQGAKAFVSEVNQNGGITRITVENGGYNYNKEKLPQLSIDSTGTGARLFIESFMGEDADYEFDENDFIEGKILSIQILNPGKGYSVDPFVDLKFSGDGSATAVANISQSFVKLPGRWISSDGIISSDEIRIQGGNYYIDFSYVISSKIEFQRYKEVVGQLVKPAGTIGYARYKLYDELDTNLNYFIYDELNREVVGTVDVSSNLPYVWGTNTYFVLANNIGLLTEGTYIIVNSEIRIVNSIINNTTITVSESYNRNANDQLVILPFIGYNAITTEYWRELSSWIVDEFRYEVLTTEEDYNVKSTNVTVL